MSHSQRSRSKCQKLWITSSVIVTDIPIKPQNFRPVVFELHAAAFSLPWSCPWTYDLKTKPWPWYSKDVSPYIGVNAAGVATPQYLTCRGRPVLTTPRYFDKCFIFSFQRNFWIPQVAVIFIYNAPLNFSNIITDLFTDFSQLAVQLTLTHISNDLIITRNWLIYWQ